MPSERAEAAPESGGVVARASGRRDQTRCPKCQRLGCPRKGGREVGRFVVRYRQCSTCQHSFKTVQEFGPDGMAVGAEVAK